MYPVKTVFNKYHPKPSQFGTFSECLCLFVLPTDWRYQAFPDTGCVQNNIGELLPISAVNCGRLCQFTRNCVGFAYRASESRCWIKSKCVNGESHDNIMTYVKKGSVFQIHCVLMLTNFK